jgi:hypothetical protein
MRADSNGHHQLDDDWRLEVDLDEMEKSDWLAAILAAKKLEHDLSVEFQDRVIASQDGTRIFFYAATREQCDATAKALKAEVNEQGWTVTTDLTRWHPLAEEWEAPDVPMPKDSDEISAERAILMRREQAETSAKGYPEFEVRVDLPSHHDAKTLCDHLEAEGLSPVRRWRFVLVAVTDEVTGEALAERIRSFAPAGSRATVEGTLAAVRNDLRLSRPSPISVVTRDRS